MWIIDFQREIYLAFANHIKGFALGGGWGSFLAFLPMGAVFGAVHALTPGHSKTVLATYLTGSTLKAHRALFVSIVLAVTHVGTAVLIALLALPLVSHSFVDAGFSPPLQTASRALLGVIGLWMLYKAAVWHCHVHPEGEGIMVAVAAGLVPCPLTLFVMTFAMLHQVVVTGLFFAVAMAIGVGITLSAVAMLAVLFRERIGRLLATRPGLLHGASRILEGAAGGVLVLIAVQEFAGT